jgi:hypothetical protein
MTEDTTVRRPGPDQPEAATWLCRVTAERRRSKGEKKTEAEKQIAARIVKIGIEEACVSWGASSDIVFDEFLVTRTGPGEYIFKGRTFQSYGYLERLFAICEADHQFRDSFFGSPERRDYLMRILREAEQVLYEHAVELGEYARLRLEPNGPCEWGALIDDTIAQHEVNNWGVVVAGLLVETEAEARAWLDGFKTGFKHYERSMWARALNPFTRPGTSPPCVPTALGGVARGTTRRPDTDNV